MSAVHALAVAPAPPGAQDLSTARRRLVKWHLGFDRSIGWLLALLFGVAIVPIADVVYWIATQALPHFTLSDFQPSPIGAGLYGPIVGTIELMVIATAFALAFGLLGGIAVAEFLPDRVASWMRLGANTLAGLPAIILGFFGYFFFVDYLGWGQGILAAGLTTAVFMTPYIFRATDLAFTSVPRHIREAAYGSGARPSDYILRVARPIVLPQILNGTFIAVALGVGETATLILTLSYSGYAPAGLAGPAGFITGTVFYNLTSPVPSLLYLAYEAAFLLIVTVIALNVVVRLISWRSEKRLAGLFQ
ncbi:MAG: PstA family ABC transporter permease [Thermoplasmata archaeon]